MFAARAEANLPQTLECLVGPTTRTTKPNPTQLLPTLRDYVPTRGIEPQPNVLQTFVHTSYTTTAKEETDSLY